MVDYKKSKILPSYRKPKWYYQVSDKILSSELQEVFLIYFVQESTTMLHVFAWSFIKHDINRDAWLDCLHRQFQTRSSHLRCRTPPNAGCAATSNPLLWLLSVPPQPNACCRKAGGNSAVPAARPAARRAAAGHQQWLVQWAAVRIPLSGNRSESAADALRCLPPPCHRRWGLEIQWLICTAFPASVFHSLAYSNDSMAYSMYITPFCGK